MQDLPLNEPRPAICHRTTVEVITNRVHYTSLEALFLTDKFRRGHIKLFVKKGGKIGV